MPRLKQPMTTLRSILTFYRSYAFVSTAITIVCAFLLLILGIESYTPLFWFKLTTLALIYFYIRSYKRQDFYYYQNLGLSKKTLWVSTLSFDFIVFNILLILTLGLS